MAFEVARKGGVVIQNLVAYVALVVLQLVVAVELDSVAFEVTYELKSSRTLGTPVWAADIMQPFVGHQFGLGIEAALAMRTTILAQVQGMCWFSDFTLLNVRWQVSHGKRSVGWPIRWCLSCVSFRENERQH